MDLDRYVEENVDGFAGLVGAHDARPVGEGTLAEQGAGRSSSRGSGVVGTLAALLGHAGGSRTVSRVAIYVFFVPLVSIVTGAIFLEERLTLSLLIGTFLIVTGIYTVNRSSTEGGKHAS